MPKKSIPIFENPRLWEICDELISKLLLESERGSIIIGASYVEDELAELIRKYLPEQSNNYQKRLFKYPGQLSSFSAKIELSYAFRLINKRTYNALNALREIRNQAAHSSMNFDIKSVNFERIFDWGEGFQTLVHEVSGKMLIKFKFEQVKQMLVEGEDKTEDEAARIVAEKMQEPETHELLENQWPQWKLILGLSIICGMIQFYSDEIQESIPGINTIGQISRNNDD